MSKCSPADRYREIVFERPDGSQISAWALDRILLGQTVRLADRDGHWFIRALTTNTLCAGEIAAKAKDHPKLYPIVEVR